MKKSTDSSITWGKIFDTTTGNFEKLNRQFWDPPAKMTVEQLQLKPGMSVLDVGCGAGSTVIPEALAVGNSGKVIGIDLSDELLSAARKKAKEKGLTNIELINRDMRDLKYLDNNFDAVVSEFSIFFVSDMLKQIKLLWRLVKPGGKLAIITWGKNVLSPIYEEWFRILESIDPKLTKYDKPWAREEVSDPYNLKRLIANSGIPKSSLIVQLIVESLEITAPEEAAIYIMGTGLRAGLKLMSDNQKKIALKKLTSRFERNNITHLIRDPILALAVK